MKKKLYKIKYKATIECECYAYGKNEEDAKLAFYFRPKDRIDSTELDRNEVIVYVTELKEI